MTVNFVKSCSNNYSGSEKLSALNENTTNYTINALPKCSIEPAGAFMRYICGGMKWHSRSKCLAKNEICKYCGNIGRYAKFCRKRKESINCIGRPTLVLMKSLHASSSKHVITEVKINVIGAIGLEDTGSTRSYVCQKFVKQSN